MQCRIVFILFATGLGFLGTSSPAAPGVAGQSVSSQQAAGPKKGVPSAYTKWRQIGLLRKGVIRCPTVGGWRSRSLLSLAAQDAFKEKWQYKQCVDPEDLDLLKFVDPTDLGQIQRLGLDRLCVYEREDPDAEKPFPEHLPPDLIDSKPDQMALTATGEGSFDKDPSTLEHFARQFSLQAGQIVAQESPIVAARAAKTKVRLVFIDTQPTGEGLPLRPGNSPHGYAMAHLAHELICGEGSASSCGGVSFATQLALRYPEPRQGAESENGGELGLVSDLGRAIMAAVLRWRQGDGDKKLVLNLSVGWDEALGKLDLGKVDLGKEFSRLARKKSDLYAKKLSKLDPGVQGVYNALRFAARSGVLVIAAAGNRRGGTWKSEWPALPAAWQLRPPSFWPFTFGPKPVYAVGGVDWQPLPLSNSRPGGQPRLVAFGDHAVAAANTETGFTGIFTGTSVSTAIVSAVAAAVWQQHPELSPTEVMRHLDRSAKELPSRADFYAWKKVWLLSWILHPHQRQISLCRALGLERDCPPAEKSPLQARPNPANLPFMPATFPFSPPCDPLMRQLLTPGGGQSDNPCPMDQLVDVANARWVYPQPGANPCPSCTLVPPPDSTDSLSTSETPTSYELIGTIDPDWSGLLKSAALDIDCYTSGRLTERITFTILTGDQTLLRSDQNLNLSLGTIDHRESLAGCTATLNFEVMDSEGQSRSIQSAVYIKP
jgi:subtilase family protein